VNRGKADYLLGVGDAGADRLRLLHRVYGSGTERLLSDVGLASGMRVTDIGCGIGTVALWMARQVGATGSVVCVDQSPEQLALARCIARQSSYTNVTFLAASAERIDLPSESFDVVYCRFLLDHLIDPQAAVVEMRRLLRPNGVLVTETLDLSGIATDPPDPVYVDEVRLMREIGAARGIDGASGMKVHRLFRAAGFASIEVRLNQPAYLRGEEKRFWEYSIAESKGALVGHGFCALEEVERRVREIQRVNLDETILVALPRCVQVWARK